MKPLKFIFDLDGTITSEEIMAVVAQYFNLQEEMRRLTEETLGGHIPYVESFIRRIQILKDLSVSEVDNLVEKVKIYPEIMDFIHQNKEQCVVTTGNLACWTSKLLQKIGCDSYSSEAIVENDRVIRLEKILRKETIVEKYKSEGYEIVFVGEGNNDLEAMRTASISIAAGMTHYPSNSILPVSDYLIFNEKALCRQLNQLLSVVPE